MYWGKVNRILICTIMMTCLWCGSTVANTVGLCLDGDPHEFESHILIPNTEESEGQVENVCTRCDFTYIEYLPATGHTYGEWQLVEEQDGSRIERSECLQCHRTEVRVVRSEPEQLEPEMQKPELSWHANEMDYILSASIAGLWSYIALVLWYNSLVLNWYKRECRKKLKGRR